MIEAAGLTPDAEPVFDIRNGMTAEDNPRWKGGKPEWTCANCGKTFRSWPRGYGKPCRRAAANARASGREDEGIGRDSRPAQGEQDPERRRARGAEIQRRWAAEDANGRWWYSPACTNHARTCRARQK